MNKGIVLARLRAGCRDPFTPIYCDSGGSSTSTAVNYSPEEAARRTNVMDAATGLYNQTGAAMTNQPYPGTAPAAFSPDTLAGQQYARDYALGPAVQQSNNINQATQFGLKDVLYPQTNPALRQTIDASVRPVREAFMDTGGVFSNIRDQAREAGQFGSSRHGVAEGIAAGRYADALADTAAKVSTEGYNKGLDTFSRTLAFAPQALQSGLMPSNILSGIGAQNEMQAQQLEDYLSNARMWEYNAPWLPLQNYANIVFGGATPTTTSSVNQGSNPLSMLGQAGTAALGFSQLLPMLATSDSRLKENVEKVGVDYNTGLNLYEFNYIADPHKRRWRGVMADEVIKVRPAAVMQNRDGYMMVNYTMLGIPFERVEGENHV